MLTALDKLPNDTLLRRPTVQAMVPICKSTFYEKIKQGEFPAPIPIGKRAVGWRLGDVRAWLKDPLGWKPDNGGQ